MADVLLAHSYHLPYDRKQVRKMQPYPPLGTLYAAGVLRQEGISVAVFDAMLEEPGPGFQEALRLHRPKIVAIFEDDFNFLTKMCLTRMREVAWQMISQARSAGARVVVHGSDATDHSLEYLRQGCEFILTGESEYALLHVVQAMSNGGDPSRVPGVVWVKRSLGKETLDRQPRLSPRNVECFPLPARDLINIDKYREAWHSAHGRFSMNLIASRGCPFRCNWCAKPIFGDTYHLRPAHEVAAEMLVLKNAYGADHLWFADDIFALNRHWVHEFASAVEELRCAVPFKIQARADLLTWETVEALRRAGCAEVWMGVESGSQKVLDAMEKGLKVEEVIAARENLKRHGIRACYFLQFGYPGELWQDLQSTVSLVRATRPDDIGISFSYPLPGTRFYERVKQQLGAKENWSDSDDLCVMFKGAYKDEFYRDIRDALHAEVDSWQATDRSARDKNRLRDAWKRIALLEPVSRNPEAISFSDIANEVASGTSSNRSVFVPIHGLLASAGEG
ncbi:MAG TPA: radical SAM protein [Candidatus Acidoferrum sp.]|nr:radical SAM protein [Candidatus Acidoferrum sp.]